MQRTTPLYIFSALLLSAIFFTGCKHVLPPTKAPEESRKNISVPVTQETTPLPQAVIEEEQVIDSVPSPESVDDTPSSTIESLSDLPTKSEPATEARTVKEFRLTARQWSFDPGVITVQKGDTVRLTISSVDVNHGFAISDFGVNEFLSPGSVVVVEFLADKSGTFSFFCSVSCGSGHSNMRGTLIVNE